MPSDAQVKQLEWGEEQKKQKREQPYRRKIRQEHGTPILSLPRIFLEMGLKLNQEVVVEKRGSNPLNWEIVIKPNLEPHESVQQR